MGRKEIALIHYIGVKMLYLLRNLKHCSLSLYKSSSANKPDKPKVYNCQNLSRYCKTQNSGLGSKEEKQRDPINQPSRCNTQEGLLTVVQTGDSNLLGGRAPRTANWASFLYAKRTYYQHITYELQGDWLHVCKAVLLVQTSRAFVQT